MFQHLRHLRQNSPIFTRHPDRSPMSSPSPQPPHLYPPSTPSPSPSTTSSSSPSSPSSPKSLAKLWLHSVRLPRSSSSSPGSSKSSTPPTKWRTISNDSNLLLQELQSAVRPFTPTATPISAACEAHKHEHPLVKAAVKRIFDLRHSYEYESIAKITVQAADVQRKGGCAACGLKEGADGWMLVGLRALGMNANDEMYRVVERELQEILPEMEASVEVLLALLELERKMEATQENGRLWEFERNVELPDEMELPEEDEESLEYDSQEELTEEEDEGFLEFVRKVNLKEKMELTEENDEFFELESQVELTEEEIEGFSELESKVELTEESEGFFEVERMMKLLDEIEEALESMEGHLIEGLIHD
ncbi:hypothetical protein BZA05DRAFT_416262 [Tricharina praecox]|uniref:uncharacterized protein n=1 Tax=Tricharina praecox TaxID=43433 RepID=UPI0022208684|nr:uncharacterized protein BZA05DRAFT_416262 [Tricharina praecox]KAI5856609.1 hypothetical protein BZA05DRAFT_416262 [Tricharina praecox]